MWLLTRFGTSLFLFFVLLFKLFLLAASRLDCPVDIMINLRSLVHCDRLCADRPRHRCPFAKIYRDLIRLGGVVTVTSAATIAAEVQRLMQDETALAAVNANAKAALDRMAGALGRTTDALMKLLPPEAERAVAADDTSRTAAIAHAG